ncbi:MAG: hypothetical protein ISR65_15315 [Bacteriovoracaceae bacterium]|nr:hypothetical protein [Bacteriovoracaceae bacterium]
MQVLKLLRVIPFALALLTFIWAAHGKEYIIYSVAQDLPMGEDNEVVRKNFYLNIGDKQGVMRSSVMDVYRTISRLDPYQNKQRFSYKVKIAELKVLHSETNASIGILTKKMSTIDDPLFEINAPMVGDEVRVQVDRLRVKIKD